MSFQQLSMPEKLEEVYRCLYDAYGPQHWWPADTPFEMIVGAILTQSTAWTNVEKAIINLKEGDALNTVSMRSLPIDELAEMIRPSGYYNAKARKLQAFVWRLAESHNDSLEMLFSGDTPDLRRELLSIYGVGPETADSIILYAARRPVFVIDAYTHRITDRLGLNPDTGNYHALQNLFMQNLPPDERMFNEFHALLVCLGKNVCRPRTPLCSNCCLTSVCPSVVSGQTDW